MSSVLSARRERVLVAMSGGVDSSVAALLLCEQGYDVIGVTLHLWDASGEQKVGRCCAPEDREDARRTADHLGFPHYVFDERGAFRAQVVEPFVQQYLHGSTPVPCVACNQSVKLARLVELADALGARHVATGHYARLVAAAQGVRLLRGVDRQKDQSYFLYGVGQHVLGRMLFPLGELTKDVTREHARRGGLPNADKGDSQALCFVPEGSVGEFIASQAPAADAANQCGSVVDEAGTVLGAHAGLHHFTVGQRRGLKLAGGAAKYVLRIVPETRQVVVGGAEGLLSDELAATGATWTRGSAPSAVFDGWVRIRYRHEPARAVIHPSSDGFRAEFVEPQRAVAPGQAAVVYVGDEVVGGGTIASAATRRSGERAA